MSYDRDALIELIAQESLRRGQFTLASGKQASYYLDCRKVTLHPKGANLIAAGMLEVMQSTGQLPDAVGGMAIGADPITASIVTLAGQNDLHSASKTIAMHHGNHRNGKVSPDVGRPLELVVFAPRELEEIWEGLGGRFCDGGKV